jgi:hypothetical protein
MAMHRKPVGVPTPPELLVFRQEDWTGSDEGWFPEYERWIEERRAYGKAHPDSALGSALDQLRFERQVLDQRRFERQARLGSTR